MRSPWGCTVWWVGGAARGPDSMVTVAERSHVPGSVWPAAVVVCGGRMMGRLEMGIWTRLWTGSCWVAAFVEGAAAGGRGARVVVGWGSWLWSWSRLGRCRLGLCCCVWGVVCAFLGAGLGCGVGFGVEVRVQFEEDLCLEV